MMTNPIFDHEVEKPKLAPDEFRAVGFIPGYCKFDAVECMHLNEQLAIRLAGKKAFSEEWYSEARSVHQMAKSLLRCCG